MTTTRFKRWGESGIRHGGVETVNGNRDLEALIIDSTAARARQHGAGVQKKKVFMRSVAHVAN